MSNTEDHINARVTGARHRLERAALSYVAARGQVSVERLLLATVELDRASHALAVTLDDAGIVVMPVKCPRCLTEAP